MIREIQIENFKSIPSLKMELGRFNVLIGANGCGKSNILEAIAMGCAAASDKLDNEFLGNRGIRVSENELMISGFNGGRKDGFSIEFKDDLNGFINFNILNYITWTVDTRNNSFQKESDKEYVEIEEFIEHGSNLDSQKTSKSLRKITSSIAQRKLEFIDKNSIKSFFIFAPENYYLRNPFEENVIKPIGIKGEGLFLHLSAIGFKNPLIFNELKENLTLIDWFDNIEFDTTNDGYFTGRIKIKDRYLEEGVKYFDQRSANEGFLFLLFYLTLFISSETPKFFAIDNIDNALNPKLGADLMKILAKLAEKHDKQVIFTTHNPAILDGLDLSDDEQRLFVISRNKSGHTKALRVPDKERNTRLSESFIRGYIGGLPKNF
jgi:predicted ATPase